MAESEAKGLIPESVLKKRKREEQWALEVKEKLEEKRKKNRENRKLISKRAEQYAKEYENQVGERSKCLFFLSDLYFSLQCLLKCIAFLKQEKELSQLKREARLKGGFYVCPEAKLLFIIRIRG